jgi:hypothetical protein
MRRNRIRVGEGEGESDGGGEEKEEEMASLRIPEGFPQFPIFFTSNLLLFFANLQSSGHLYTDFFSSSGHRSKVPQTAKTAYKIANMPF